MCLDYREFNAKTTRYIYKISSSEDIFSSLNLSSGYHQVPITEEDKKKTAFSTRHGQFEFNRKIIWTLWGTSNFSKTYDHDFKSGKLEKVRNLLR